MQVIINVVFFFLYFYLIGNKLAGGCFFVDMTLGFLLFLIILELQCNDESILFISKDVDMFVNCYPLIRANINVRVIEISRKITIQIKVHLSDDFNFKRTL